MENSNNFFQLVAEFQKNIDWLNQILKGGDTDNILIDGVFKPSISKDIADKWAAIQALVAGRAAYETKSQLPSPPPSGIVLAEVWNDGTDNGLYGWTGSEWLLSNYDRIKSEVGQVYIYVDSLPKSDDILGVIGAQNTGDYQLVDFNGHMVELLPLYVDADDRVCLGVTRQGNLVSLLSHTTLQGIGWENYDSPVGYQMVSFAILDDDGRCVLAFDKDGNLTESGGLLKGVRDDLGIESYGYPVDGKYQYAVLDEDGALAFGVKDDGTVDMLTDGDKLFGVNPPQLRKHHHTVTQTDWNFTLVQGQSLSRGWDFTQTPALSTTQPYNNMAMPEPNWPSDGSTKFTPCVERQEYPWTETICSGSVNQVSFLLEQALKPWENWKHDQVIACNGVGGARIDEINKGTSPWNLGMALVKAAKRIADDMGETIAVHGTHWVQGESNNYINPPGDPEDYIWYKAMLIAVKNDFNVDVAALTGQTDRIPLFTYQVTSHAGTNDAQVGVTHWPAAAIGQWKASLEDDEIVCVGPIYQFSFSDGVHMDNHGYRHMGHYYAKAYYEWNINQRKFLPLQPTQIKRISPNHVDITFHVPYPPLVFDTDLVLATPDYGFTVQNADDSLIDIVSVNISSPTTVTIITRDNIPDDAIVSYARRVTHLGMKGPAGRGGSRGNLRDCDPTLALDNGPDGKPYPLYNWSVCFIESIEV